MKTEKEIRERLESIRWASTILGFDNREVRAMVDTLEWVIDYRPFKKVLEE